MKRVLQTGTYSSRNKGDAAMQLVLSRELSRATGGECVIGVPFPDVDESFYAPTRTVRSRRRNLALGTLRLGQLLAYRALGRRKTGSRFDPELDEMIRSDAVVDLSGDMLTEDYGPHVGYSHFIPLLQAIALDKPLFVTAQSIGPFRALSPLARFVLRRAAAVTVREPISYERMLALGVPKERLALTADLAFLLEPVAPERVDEILRQEGFVDSGRPLLGVSVSALLINQLHGSLQKAGGDPLGAIAAVLDRICERHGFDPVLVAHVTGPKKRADDREITAALQRRMKRPALCLEGDYRPEELKGVISRCTAFFGFRMHANIAALDSAVPTLAVGYSHKTLGIMKLFDLEQYVLPFAEIEEQRLEARFEALLAARGEIRRKLEEKLPEVRAAARENVELIAATLAKEVSP